MSTLWGDAGRQGLVYLRGRGLTDETIRRFKLGSRPQEFAKTAIVSNDARSDDAGGRTDAPAHDGRSPYDFFRDRVIFPIRDGSRPIAFGRRTMGDSEPKYLNSTRRCSTSGARSLALRLARPPTTACDRHRGLYGRYRPSRQDLMRPSRRSAPR